MSAMAGPQPLMSAIYGWCMSLMSAMAGPQPLMSAMVGVCPRSSLPQL